MMRNARLLFFSLVFSTFFLGLQLEGNTQTNEFKSLSPLVKQLSPSVVNISTTSVSKSGGQSFESPFGEREIDHHMVEVAKYRYANQLKDDEIDALYAYFTATE